MFTFKSSPSMIDHVARHRLLTFMLFFIVFFASLNSKRLSDENDFAILHIPKCAGRSFAKDMREILSKHDDKQHAENLVSTEHCFEDFYKKKNFNVVFLRNPRSHVLSQFLECKYDYFGQRVTKGTNFPREGEDKMGFAEWVNFFAAKWTPSKGHFHCYNPINMQTRYLALHHNLKVGDQYGSRCHGVVGDVEPDLEEAQNQLEKFDLVGVVEFYPVFLCLISFTLYEKLPSECICQSSNKLETSHQQHGVPAHSWKDHPSKVLEKIDGFTQDDLKLYKAGLRMFFDEVQRVEIETNRTILCDNYIASARDEISYVEFKKSISYL